jgi:tetratricopeptide (TPR) repeat protein
VAGARAAFRRAAAAGGASGAEGWHRLGLLELAEGRRKEALAALEQAMAADGAEPRFVVDLARARAAGGGAGDRQAALDLLERVATRQPYAPAFLEAGRLLAAGGRLPQAAAALGRAAQAGLPEAHAELAAVLDRMGRPAEARYQRGLGAGVYRPRAARARPARVSGDGRGAAVAAGRAPAGE